MVVGKLRVFQFLTNLDHILISRSHEENSFEMCQFLRLNLIKSFDIENFFLQDLGLGVSYGDIL